MTTCGGFVELSYGGGADTASYQFYDARSKQLVAIVYYVNFFNSWRCVGGPPGFVLPKCPGAAEPLACSDAGEGADAGAE